MNAVKFDWLKDINISINGDNKAEIEMSHKNQYGEIEWVSFHAELDTVEIDYTADGNPENAIPCEFYNLKDVEFFTLYDFDNIYAIADMPFHLTSDQEQTINSYLNEIKAESF